ncbi:MAG: Crp/Fnr family transcriptional regulator, partial [Pseudomonadota bacterium]
DFLGQPFAQDDKLQTEAATDVRLCSFPRSVINSFVEENPEIEQRLHEQHSRELDEARDWMLTLGRKNATEKVASFILMLVNHIEPEHEGKISELEIALPLKRADIADFLGLTIETVSRQVTNLRKLGVIDVNDRKSIVVLNPERLERIAEGE